jgi:NAD+ diphosphatase
MQLAFVNSPLDRGGNNRADPAWLERKQQTGRCQVIRMAGDSLAFAGGAPDLTPAADRLPELFLGTAPDGTAWFAETIETAADLRPLRQIALDSVVNPETLGILAQARSLLNWHERHCHCAQCGSVTTMTDGGTRRHCFSCGGDHFPRTDPVVIIAVRRGDDILLGRQADWPPGMYSALAGFMEPGETIEQAARREVFEEAGVRVDKVCYVMSQPWPFPSSLMIGLTGEALNGDLQVDHREIEAARWFSAREAHLMLHKRHPDGLWAANPMAIAWHLVDRLVGEITLR